MKKLFVFSTLLFVMLGVFSSCQKGARPSEQYIKDTILGKWRLASINGKAVITNFGTVDTYNPDGDWRMSLANGNTWMYQKGGTYRISGSSIIKPSDRPGQTEGYREDKVISINNSTLDIEVIIDEAEKGQAGGPGEGPGEGPEAGDKPFESGTWEYTRINADYHVSIVGTWEGVEMTGEETYGDANHRWEYKLDGTFVYYVKDGGGNWVTSENVGNEYFVDGDFLATRWKKDAESDYDYEWWDITNCNTTEMNWSALREKEDGTRYTATFKMKKIEEVRPPLPE